MVRKRGPCLTTVDSFQIDRNLDRIIEELLPQCLEIFRVHERTDMMLSSAIMVYV